MEKDRYNPFATASASAEEANRLVEPIVLRHGEHVNDPVRIADALEFMAIVGLHLRDPNGLRIMVKAATVELARKHLAAFLEEALDTEMPIRKDPNIVVVRGFGGTSAIA